MYIYLALNQETNVFCSKFEKRFEMKKYTCTTKGFPIDIAEKGTHN